jgi:hypothetical protein
MNKSALKKPSYHVSSISTDGIGCTITFTLDGQSTKRGGKKKKTTTAPSAHPPPPPAHTGAPLPCPPATTMEPNKKWMSQHKLRYTLKQRARETETKRIAQRREKFEKEKNIKRTEEELIKKFLSSSTKTSEEERC